MWYVILIIVVLVILNTSTSKAIIGEFFINRLLNRLDKSNYSIYKNLDVSLDDGNTSQIDHIIVSKYGIFVIKSYNYDGWISGDETNPIWIQTIYRTKLRFLNPVLENKGDIKALNSYLNLDTEVYKSIIVFALRSILQKVETVTPVIHSYNLVKQIRKQKDILISDEELILIQSKLEQRNNN